ncbi:MAG: ABC transporter permease, partial [Bacteroidota bacterium]
MFQNYFKTALRHLKNHKSHVAINVVGLGFGIASCLIAYLLWNFDTDFDRFHTKADQLYRIETVKSNTQELYGIAPAPLADLAKQNMAGVKDAVIMDYEWTTMNVADRTFNQRVLFTSDNFLQWFDFEILTGTAQLNDPSTVLLTEKMAKKYFGDENPIGQNFKLYPELHRQKNLIVTGVVKDHPVNSSVVFDFITNTQNRVDPQGNRYQSANWELWRDAIFLALEKGQSADKILPQLDQYVAAHQAARPDFKTKQFF